jgi:phosphoribosylamine--glycine ligase
MVTTNTKSKILVVGSGGREHAIAWKLGQSSNVEKIFVAPGNGGTANLHKTENVEIDVMNFSQLAKFGNKEKIDLVVVGPDNPLAEGITDYLNKEGLKVFGPDQKAAKLESSKAFAKDFMSENRIPTARYQVCTALSQAADFVSEHPWARVIKVDGLALGKGVFVTDSKEEALEALYSIFKKRQFGAAGAKVVIEEKLTGQEASLLLFVDGSNFVPMPISQDHKQRFDFDKGPNTGGMGAYSPVDIYSCAYEQISTQVLTPLTQALRTRKLQYKGILYIGLMIDTIKLENGETTYQPYVLEFNCRFGDPEAQTLLPLLESDLLPILLATTEGKLKEVDIQWSKNASCCVVAVGNDYPEKSSKDKPITINSIPENVYLFHSGTKLNNDTLLTNGGRILSVTAIAPTLAEAIDKAYQSIDAITFSNMAYRKDIGRRAASLCQSR